MECLEVLNLRSNRIGDSGAEKIAAALPTEPTLEQRAALKQAMGGANVFINV